MAIRHATHQAYVAVQSNPILLGNMAVSLFLVVDSNVWRHSHETNGPLATIGFRRPHRLNAVVEPFYDKESAAFELAESDTAVRAIIVRDEGHAFCVGADLGENATD
jgi:1,4-dihydroxy-2-naphthoyl-CoA synthase